MRSASMIRAQAGKKRQKAITVSAKATHRMSVLRSTRWKRRKHHQRIHMQAKRAIKPQIAQNGAK